VKLVTFAFAAGTAGAVGFALGFLSALYLVGSQ